MTWNVRHAALAWVALAASGAASLDGCGQSNCTEKATCPDPTADGGEGGSPADATTGDAPAKDARTDVSSDSPSEASVTDASDGGSVQCGALGLACCGDAGCGAGLECGDAGAC